MSASRPVLAAFLAILCTLPAAGRAGVLYGTFTAGQGYDAYLGFPVSGSSTVATSFTVNGRVSIQQITVAVAGPSACVALYTSAGSVLGSHITGWVVGNTPSTPPSTSVLDTISGIDGVSLTAGTYFIQVSAPPGGGNAQWRLSLLRATGTTLINGKPFTLGGGPAFEIDGIDTPPPSGGGGGDGGGGSGGGHSAPSKSRNNPAC